MQKIGTKARIIFRETMAESPKPEYPQQPRNPSKEGVLEYMTRIASEKAEFLMELKKKKPVRYRRPRSQHLANNNYN